MLLQIDVDHWIETGEIAAVSSIDYCVHVDGSWIEYATYQYYCRTQTNFLPPNPRIYKCTVIRFRNKDSVTVFIHPQDFVDLLKTGTQPEKGAFYDINNLH